MESPWSLEVICAISSYRVFISQVNVNRIKEIDSLIEAVEKKLVRLDDQRAIILNQLDELKQQRHLLIKQNTSDSTSQTDQLSVTNHSSESEKIALFRSLFRGREDVFARRFESAKTGKSGYQPCCRNEWVQGIRTVWSVFLT